MPSNSASSIQVIAPVSPQQINGSTLYWDSSLKDGILYLDCHAVGPAGTVLLEPQVQFKKTDSETTKQFVRNSNGMNVTGSLGVQWNKSKTSYFVTFTGAYANGQVQVMTPTNLGSHTIIVAAGWED